MSLMGCGSFGVHTVLVGLHRVGIAGLREALRDVDEQGLADRNEIVDSLMRALATQNFVPDSMKEDYRVALWREYLRHKGRAFREFFSRIEVTVRGEDGEERDRFVKMLHAAFEEFELNPVVTFAAPADDGPNPQLVIDGDVVLAGRRSRDGFQTALRKSISDW